MSAVDQTDRRYIPSSDESNTEREIRQNVSAKKVNNQINMFLRTASTSINFSVWAVLDAVNRSMMTFEHLRFLTIDFVDTNPFVTCTPSDKPILPNWVDRCGRWCIRQVQAMSWCARFGRLCGDESNHVSGGNDESLCL